MSYVLGKKESIDVVLM